MGVALTAYVVNMLSRNADPRTTVDSAKGSITPASVKEGGHRTPTCHNRLLPSHVLNPNATPFESTPTTNTLCANNVKTILLQTARARVYNPSTPQSTIEMHVLLNSGSQRSYMTERA